ncbi:hypothetical protein GCM10010508_16910 [Streptomyces naganishii JCM 4654]|uniref:Uncharacterized protein n=1 Tax=Streptomyces naganishii JCM 4654 TaxID=1306179 RepID=A0A918Y1M6_9ACTN|nr:hypothetical protein GCM10010508_16910 [Streptomyces naganishii JCM 4654]
MKVEAGNVDRPPPADAAQQDVEFVARTHALCLLCFPIGRDRGSQAGTRPANFRDSFYPERPGAGMVS